MTTKREQPWSDDPVQGRIVVLTRNPIAEAIETIAGTAGREVVVVADDEDGRGRASIAGLPLGESVTPSCSATTTPPMHRRCSGTRWPRRRRTSR